MSEIESPEQTTVRVVLDEQVFAWLVAGEIATVEGSSSSGQRIDVEIILSDIGWARMLAAISRARAK